MRNFDAAKKRHESDPMCVPVDLTSLPTSSSADLQPDLDGEAHPPCVLQAMASDASDAMDVDADAAVDRNGYKIPKRNVQNSARTSPLSFFCGRLPEGKALGDFHSPPAGKLHHKSVESLYWRDLGERLNLVFGAGTTLDDVVGVEDTPWRLSGAGAAAAAERQKIFFSDVDKYLVPDLSGMQHSASTVGLDTAIGTAVQQMPKSYVQSRTMFMEAAFCFLQQGLLNIPDIGGVNVKQARALLWNAAWLQEHMNRVWSAEAMPGGSPACHGRPTDTDAFEQFDLLIIGPGGTGKTAVLKITEALTTYFAGPNVVQKLAPSNAAARLLGGDTIHAMLKLPFGKATLTSKKGRLTKGTLSIHKRKWASSIAAYLDEISWCLRTIFFTWTYACGRPKI